MNDFGYESPLSDTYQDSLGSFQHLLQQVEDGDIDAKHALVELIEMFDEILIDHI